MMIVRSIFNVNKCLKSRFILSKSCFKKVELGNLRQLSSLVSLYSMSSSQKDEKEQLIQEIADQFKQVNANVQSNVLIEDNDDKEIEDTQEQKDSFEKIGIEDTWVCLKGMNRHDREVEVMKTVKKLIGVNTINIERILKERRKNSSLIKFGSLSERNLFVKLFREREKDKKLRLRSVPIGEVKEDTGHPIAKVVEIQEYLRTKIVTPTKEDIQKEMEISLEERVCPLWKMKYEDQIALKKKDLLEVVASLQQRIKEGEESRELVVVNENVKDSNNEIVNTIETHKKDETQTQENHLADQIPFIECPQEYRVHYRNKTEFTIGLNSKGKVTVGFNRTNFKKGIVLVDEAAKNYTSSKQAIFLAERLQGIIEASGLPVYDRLKNEGFWRYFVVRQSDNSKEILVNLVVKPSAAGSEETLKSIKSTIVDTFKKENLPEDFNYEIVSIGLQHHEGDSDAINSEGHIEILHGKSFYTETILDKTFKVSTNAFLQIHTKQCENLYKEISKTIGEIDEKTIFLDVCSGIGTIGMSLANSAKKTIGIEVIEAACEDAKTNALANGITNYQVINSKVESVIDEIVKGILQEQECKIIGVLDPPRAGLSQDVIKAIRKCNGLDELVFVACSPRAVQANLLGLCLPESKRRKNIPFVITKVFGCDLFPQTNHYEAVFLLKRDTLSRKVQQQIPSSTE